MYDANKIKTFTPVLPVGIGGTGTRLEDALYDIVNDLNETNGVKLDSKEVNTFVRMLINLLDINDWTDGEYTLFEDYMLVVETMAKGKLDEMPEFNGY